jgi:hypothetical protein
MRKMKFIVLCFIVVMAFASYASAGAQTYTEYRGVDGGDWNIAANWSNGVPLQLDPLGGPQGAFFGKAGFKGWSSNNGKSPGLYAGTVNVDQIVVGGVTPGAAQYGYLNIDGGTLNVSEFGHLGNGATDNGTITINSGTLNCGTMIPSLGNLKVGFNGTGTLNMNGGVLNLTTYLGIADGTGATANGTVNLNGGVINATDLRMRFNNIGGQQAFLVIKDGLLKLTNAVDLTGKIEGWIDNGWIKGATGYVAETVYANGVTTVYATPEPATMSLLGLGLLSILRRKK